MAMIFRYMAAPIPCSPFASDSPSLHSRHKKFDICQFTNSQL
uniref:Uncharacterized protein n=1 Tax=Anguilla anguilla TaxID=7936 RepID=A0A0E9SZK6_ANGAN